MAACCVNQRNTQYTTRTKKAEGQRPRPFRQRVEKSKRNPLEDDERRKAEHAHVEKEHERQHKALHRGEAQKIAAAARTSRRPRGRFVLLKGRAAILLFFGGGITSALLA